MSSAHADGGIEAVRAQRGEAVRGRGEAVAPRRRVRHDPVTLVVFGLLFVD